MSRQRAQTDCTAASPAPSRAPAPSPAPAPAARDPHLLSAASPPPPGREPSPSLPSAADGPLVLFTALYGVRPVQLEALSAADVEALTALSWLSGDEVPTGLHARAPPADEVGGVEFPQRLELFTFPAGLRLSARQLSRRRHSFVLTMLSGANLYGYCSTVYEEADPALLAVIRSQEASRVRDAQSDGDDTCLPGRLYAPRSLVLLSRFPFHRHFTRMLDHFTEHTVGGACGGFPDDAAYRLYIAARGDAPRPGGSVSLAMEGGGRPSFEFALPAPCEPPLAEADFRTLMQQLSPANVIAVINAVLCEVPVLAHSTTAHLVSPCLEALTALLYPFTFPYVYITMLPPVLADILDAPQPFLIGTLSCTLEVFPVPAHALVVDLDRNAVTQPTEGGGFVPLPWRLSWRLYHAMAKHFNVFRFSHPGERLEAPAHLPPEARAAVEAIEAGESGGAQGGKQHPLITINTVNTMFSDPEDDDSGAEQKEQAHDRHHPHDDARSEASSAGAASSTGTVLVHDVPNGSLRSALGGVAAAEGPSPAAGTVSASASASSTASVSFASSTLSGEEEEEEEEEVEAEKEEVVAAAAEEEEMAVGEEAGKEEAEEEEGVGEVEEEAGEEEEEQKEEQGDEVATPPRHARLDVVVDRPLASPAPAAARPRVQSLQAAPAACPRTPAARRRVTLRHLTKARVDMLEEGEVELFAAMLMRMVAIEDRLFLLKRYEQCFVGSDAVLALVGRGFCADSRAAVALCERMMSQDLLYHVTFDHGFKDEALFYRFSSRMDGQRAADSPPTAAAGTLFAPRAASRDTRQVVVAGDRTIVLRDDVTRLRRSFLSVFVSLLRNYRRYINVPGGGGAARALETLQDGSEIFDERGFVLDRSADYREFCERLTTTQSFAQFVEERALLREPDWFEARLLRQTRRQRSTYEFNRSRDARAVMFKMGSRVPSWKRRVFELSGMAIRYYRPSRELDELGQIIDQMSAGGARDGVTAAALQKRRERFLRLKESLFIKEVRLVPEQTELSVPTTTVRYRPFKTPFPFVVRVYRSPARDKVARELLCCAQDAETRRVWLQRVRARVTANADSFIRPDVPDTLRSRLREVRRRQMAKARAPVAGALKRTTTAGF